MAKMALTVSATRRLLFIFFLALVLILITLVALSYFYFHGGEIVVEIVYPTENQANFSKSFQVNFANGQTTVQTFTQETIRANLLCSKAEKEECKLLLKQIDNGVCDFQAANNISCCFDGADCSLEKLVNADFMVEAASILQQLICPTCLDNEDHTISLFNGICDPELEKLESCCFDFGDCSPTSNDNVNVSDLAILDDMIKVQLSPCPKVEVTCGDNLFLQSLISDGQCNKDILEPNEGYCFDGLDCFTDNATDSFATNVKGCLISCGKSLNVDLSMSIYDGYCDEQLLNPDCCMDGWDCHDAISQGRNVCSKNCSLLVKVCSIDLKSLKLEFLMVMQFRMTLTELEMDCATRF